MKAMKKRFMSFAGCVQITTTKIAEAPIFALSAL